MLHKEKRVGAALGFLYSLALEFELEGGFEDVAVSRSDEDNGVDDVTGVFRQDVCDEVLGGGSWKLLLFLGSGCTAVVGVSALKHVETLWRE